MARSSQRVPGTERREQILAAATGLFARQGFRGTTTKQIASKARVNEAVLFRHFPTKEDLYWAVIEAKCRENNGQARLEQRLEAPGDIPEVFTGIATGILKQMTGDTTLMRLLLFSALEAHELSRRFYDTYVTQYHKTLAGYIQRRVQAREFRLVDPVLAARVYLGMIYQYVLSQELFSGKRSRKYDHRRVAETLTEIWLKGMKAE